MIIVVDTSLHSLRDLRTATQDLDCTRTTAADSGGHEKSVTESDTVADAQE